LACHRKLIVICVGHRGKNTLPPRLAAGWAALQARRADSWVFHFRGLVPYSGTP